MILGNKFMKPVTLMLQLVATGGLLAILILGSKSNADYLVPMIALPLFVAMTLSRFQEFLLVPDREHAPAPESKARYKASQQNMRVQFLAINYVF